MRKEDKARLKRVKSAWVKLKGSEGLTIRERVYFITSLTRHNVVYALKNPKSNPERVCRIEQAIKQATMEYMKRTTDHGTRILKKLEI